jgi:hypothetical protein
LIDQFFTNADYYKNKEFQKLMRAWNTLDEFKHFDDPRIYDQVKENLMNEFYRCWIKWYENSYDELENGKKIKWKKNLE